jgi:hypothetical protein
LDILVWIIFFNVATVSALIKKIPQRIGSPNLDGIFFQEPPKKKKIAEKNNANQKKKRAIRVISLFSGKNLGNAEKKKS